MSRIDDSAELPSNPSTAALLDALVAQRLSRRELLAGAGAVVIAITKDGDGEIGS